MGVINKYYQRALEQVLIKSFANNKIVSLLGARQTGKSTLVEYLFPKMNSIFLKSTFTIQSARANPDSFVRDLGIPAFIDEIQNAPELFHSLQDVVDKNNFYSQFIISGSNKTSMDEQIKESLSGRTSILELSGFSLRELNNVTFNSHFVPTEEYLAERKKHLSDYGNIWKYIHRGSYPELYDNPDKDWEEFYSAYVQTYIEKDVLTNIRVRDINSFTRFLSATASRTGNILDYSSVANDVGVSSTTIKEWISLLVKTNIVYLLQPYYNSHLTRAIKSPKLYFRDTGLAAFIAGWYSQTQLERGALSGAFFETFIVNELIKSFSNEGKKYTGRIFYYNGKDRIKKHTTVDGRTIESYSQSEIDLIIEEDGVLYPVEIKKNDSPNAQDARAFSILDKDLDKKRGTGVIFYPGSQRIRLAKNLLCLPIEYI